MVVGGPVPDERYGGKRRNGLCKKNLSSVGQKQKQKVVDEPRKLWGRILKKSYVTEPIGSRAHESVVVFLCRPQRKETTPKGGKQKKT